MQYAAYQFFLAKEAKFDPNFYLTYGLKQAKGSLKSDDDSIVDHAFIDIDVNESKRFILDQQLNIYGLVKYNKEKQEIILDKNNGNLNTIRTYDELIKLEEEELIDLLIKSRSPTGGVEAISSFLRTVKRFNSSGYDYPYMFKFLPKKNILRSYCNHDIQLIANTTYFQDLHFNPDNGKVKNSTLTIGLYSKTNYEQYKNYTQLYHESQKNLDPFYDFLRNLFLLQHKNITTTNQKPYVKVLEELKAIGLNSFNIQKILKNNQDIINQQTKNQIITLEQKIEEQFPDKYSNPQLKRALLLQTLYWGKREENNNDFLFPINQRDEPLLDISTQEKHIAKETLEYNIKLAQKYNAGLIKDKKITRSGYAVINKKYLDKADEFRNFASLRKIKNFRPEYDYVTDCYQFGISTAKLTTNQLETQVQLKQLSVEEQYKKQVFQKLIIPFQAKTLLRQNPFITNLKQMISKHYKEQQ